LYVLLTGLGFCDFGNALTLQVLAAHRLNMQLDLRLFVLLYTAALIG